MFKRSQYKGWADTVLQPWSLCLLVIYETAVLAVILALTIVSKTNDGFVNVHFEEIDSISHLTFAKLKHSQLRWTVVPTLVVTGLSIYFTAFLGAVADRLPYVELQRTEHDASSVRKTILLDYRSVFVLKRWWRALRNGHLLIGAALLLQLLTSLGLTTLTSGLFGPRTVSQRVAISSQLSSIFDVVNETTYLAPSLDVARAVLVSKAAPLPWTTDSLAILPLQIPSEAQSGNYTFNASAIGAKIDCQVLRQGDVNLTTASTGGTNFDVDAAFQDRGCSVRNVTFGVDSTTPKYARTWSYDCPGLYSDRLGVITADYAPNGTTKVANLAISSCITKYVLVATKTTLGFDASGQWRIQSLTEFTGADDTIEIGSSETRNLPSALKYLSYTDANNYINADSFGRAVFDYASVLVSGSQSPSDVLANATASMYDSFFASLAIQQLAVPRPQTETVNGILERARQRLFVQQPIAYVLLPLLLLMLIVSVALAVHVQRSTTFLTEEPVGILGKAILLHGSDVNGFVDDFKGRHHDKSRPLKHMSKVHPVDTAKSWVEPDEDGHWRIIRMKGMNETTTNDTSAEAVSDTKGGVSTDVRGDATSDTADDPADVV